jgi:hypothetical protein
MDKYAAFEILSRKSYYNVMLYNLVDMCQHFKLNLLPTTPR